MTKIETTRGVLALMFALALAACQTQGGATTSPAASDPRGSFGSDDMGMSDRATRAVEPSAGDFETIYFAFDDYSLTTNAKDGLRHNAALVGQSRGRRLEIQGNCDERGTEEYNLALGKRRAEAAKQYLVDLGVDGGQITTISFGEENPAVRGHSEAAWSKNRRDEFVLR